MFPALLIHLKYEDLFLLSVAHFQLLPVLLSAEYFPDYQQRKRQKKLQTEEAETEMMKMKRRRKRRKRRTKMRKRVWEDQVKQQK